MHSVTGKVVAAESGIGIPDLLIEFTDAPPSGRAGRKAKAPAPRRWGAVSTDGNGAFSLTVVAGGEGGDGVDLFATVSPADGGKASQPLFASRAARRKVGRIETYVIRIPEADLARAGIDVHRAAPAVSATEAAKAIIAKARHDAVLAQASVEAEKIRLDAARAPIEAIRKQLVPDLARRLSRVSDEAAASDTYVADEDQIIERQKAVFASDLKGVVNAPERRAAVKARIALTAAEVERVKARLDAQKTISHDALMTILGEASDASAGAGRVNTNPLGRLCREMSAGEREVAGALGAEAPAPGDDPAPNPGDIAGDGVDAIESGDIPRYLARLVDTMTSPEESVLAGLEPRATQGSVARNLSDLALRPSPADRTATYEFHNLQVAFRHVWQEAIDEGILSLAEAAYNEIVLAGGSPTRDPKRPVKALLDDARALTLARAKSGPDTPSTLARGGFFNAITGVFDHFQPVRPQSLTPIVGEFLPGLLAELNQRLREEYAFTTFAASRQRRSVNFGVLVTYQQEWKPLAYQAGRLAKTITLAPKEVQRYSKTVRRRRKRSEREVEKHLSIRRQELSQTSRSEQEIIRKANTKTNFEMSSEATTKDPTGSAEATTKTAFGREASNVSESTKKSFHESVMKAAQEFTDEVMTEINTEQSDELETVESGEIGNPNDELAVTFLFYELQRLYGIRERIHRITPVVLIAQEMPKPHEINEAWLVAHDWILRRVLLDDSFAPALTYLSERIVGDDMALAEMRTNIAQQRRIVAELRHELGIVRARVATYRNMLERSLLQRARKTSGGGGGMFSSIPVVGDAIELAEDALDAVGDFINPDMPSLGDSRQDTLKDIIQRTADEERDVLMRLEREVTALNALTETYAKALAENYNHRTQVLRLRTHVKQNILYYMQAIWNHEPPDQRYLRLHEVPVPTFAQKKRYRFADLTARPGMMNAYAHRLVGLDVRPPTQLYEAEVLPDISLRATEPLAKVADLHNLRGYFGNCMIFDLKQSNPLTDFMMEPYVIQGFDELTDPDELGNYGLDEFVDYVRCLKRKLTAEAFAAVRDQLRAQYDRLVKSPRRDGDVIVVPTGSLFIEALPATTSLVERYKAIHRAIDVKRVQAEVRQRELENLRLADRLLNGEREDPTIDKKVVIEGAVGPTVPVDDPEA